jgi:integrase
MVKVEPIRDLEDIKRLKKNLKERGKVRDLLLFTMGINSALRISDLLRIQVKDVFDKNGKVIAAKKFTMREKKTKKSTYVYVNDSIEKTLKLYAETYPQVTRKPENYLFFRQKGAANGLGSEAITSNGAWRLIQQWCEDVGIQENC